MFDEVSAAAKVTVPPPDNARPEGAQFCDVDGDGDPDLYSNGALYQNVSAPGAPLFVPLPTTSSGIGYPTVMDEGTAFFDYDLDGDFDLFVAYADPAFGAKLFENRGDGTFDEGEAGIITRPCSARASASPPRTGTATATSTSPRARSSAATCCSSWGSASSRWASRPSRRPSSSRPRPRGPTGTGTATSTWRWATTSRRAASGPTRRCSRAPSSRSGATCACSCWTMRPAWPAGARRRRTARRSRCASRATASRPAAARCGGASSWPARPAT